MLINSKAKYYKYKRNVLKGLYGFYLNEGNFNYAHEILQLLRKGVINITTNEDEDWEPLAKKLRTLHCSVTVHRSKFSKGKSSINSYMFAYMS